ncbi:MAG: S-layer homology domain-containing protein, partial [Firmicutes bacterium]|nr:S-layer homology domain-containing protein [Bacillota bacterium]
MKKSLRFTGIVSAVMLLAGTFAVPSFAFIERGDVQINGESSYTLEVGETAELSITPYAEEHLPGCGMSDCPSSCGEKGCITIGPTGQQECTCVGTEYKLYEATVNADSLDDSVATAAYDKAGHVVITAKGAGTAKVNISAEFREYNSAEKTVEVTVKGSDSGEDSSKDDNKGSSSDSGSSSSSSEGSTGGSSSTGGSTVTAPEETVKGEPVTAQSYTVRSYNDSRAEDDQNVEVKIKFSAPVKVLSGAEKDLIVKIAGNTLDKTPNASDGVSTRTLSVKADPSDSTSVIVTIGSVKGSKFIRMTNAKLEIEAAESGIKNIVSAADNTPVKLSCISTVIPSGLAFTQTAAVTGTASQPASVTKKISHRANVRGMVYIQPLKNGQPLLPTATFDHEGSYIIHAHAFIDTKSGDQVMPEMTEADYAKVIADTFKASIEKVPELKDAYEMTYDGGSFTLKALKATAGETLDVRIYESPEADGKVNGSTSNNSNTNTGSIQFSDVNGWEKEYVYYLAERKILNGKADGLFKPADNITRAEFVKILAAVSGQDVSKSTGTSFSDV